MSTATATRPATTHVAERPRTAAGTWSLVRFALRRDRARLPLWVAGAAALVALQSSSSQRVYDTPEAIAVYERTAEASAAVIAMTGRTDGLDTVARAVAFEIYATTVVVVCLMSVFTVVRHTRADEEAGRAELVRATQVGRRAPLLAAVAVATLANLAVAVTVGLVGVATGLPTEGSFLLGASFAGPGLVLTGVAAITAQVSGHARGASGLGGVVIGSAFVLRAVGDVQDNWVSWLSPIGWGQATYPFHLDRWWPLLLCVAATVGLVVLAGALLDRRDHGAGLLQPRLGPAAAHRWLGTPLGLAWRLQRGAWWAWTLGIAFCGLVFGSLVEATADLIDAAPEIAEVLPGGAEQLTAGYLVLTVQFLALLAGTLGTSAALRPRAEEVDGRAEPVLATATSRWAFAGSHVGIALVGSAVALVLGGLTAGATAAATGVGGDVVSDTLRSAVVHVPAVWVFVGLTALLAGASARLAGLAWLGVGWAVLALMLGTSLDLPAWALWLSPLDHVPAVPLEEVSLGGPVALLALSAVLVAVGLGLWRRRDLRTS